MRRGAGAVETGAAGGGTATGATGGCAATAGEWAITGVDGGGVGGAACGGFTAMGGRFAGGATVTAGRGGGADLAAFSACLRSRIAFSASPGLDTWDRSNLGLVSEAAGVRTPDMRVPRLKYPRTFSASSSSMELECVFFSVTPTAVRASRMDLLLTSNSRARSLMRTLLIKSFSIAGYQDQPLFNPLRT